MISYLGTTPACLLFARMNPVNTRKKSQRALREALFFFLRLPSSERAHTPRLARDASEGEEETQRLKGKQEEGRGWRTVLWFLLERSEWRG